MASITTRLVLAAALLTATANAGCDSCGSKGKNDAGAASSATTKAQTPKMIDCLKAIAVAQPHYDALAKYPSWSSEEDAKKGAELAKTGAQAAASFKGTDEGVNKAFTAWADAIKALGPALEDMASAMANADKTTKEIAEKKKAGGLKKEEEQAMVTKMISANGEAQSKVNPVSAQQKKAYGDLLEYCRE